MTKSATYYTHLFLVHTTTLLRKMSYKGRTAFVWANGLITETTQGDPTMHRKSKLTLVITRKAINKPHLPKSPVYHVRRVPSDTCRVDFRGIAQPFSHEGFPGMRIHCWGKDFGGLETYTMDSVPDEQRYFPRNWDGHARHVNTRTGKVTWV